jgi:hypothetical protein
VQLDQTTLRIYKKKTSSQPKYTRVLTPGEYRLVVPVVEANPAFFTFEIVAADPNS